SCPYCDNPTVISQNVSGVMRPDVIIPFKLDKNDAKAGLLKFYNGKSLMPRMFKDENVIDKIRGIYVPFWLFCCDADGAASYHATRVRTWSDAKYTYTQTNHYSVYREGGAHFEQIPVDASSKMDDNLMDSIEPYDYTEAIPFGSSYLSGYVSDKYDVDQQASIPRAGERVKNTMDDYLRKSVLGYATVTKTGSRIATSNGRAIYALLPVWILNTKWKDKTYTFAMNGQTGKFVGDLPCDTGKFWLKMLTITLSIAAPLFILALLFL
ncbi:MAG: hypothetical protein KBS59_04325, partial [Clostridiales bacterium]|nr:hypothetical protein [Clostridiales bacterium]